MTKQTIIIAIIILGLAYYYYQNYQNQTSAKPTLSELKEQLNHYRDLAQQKINEYSGQPEQITKLTAERDQWKNSFEEQTEKISGQEQKISDLETALLNLAKQKIKGKKEAQTLLNQLEANQKKDKQSWQEEQKRLIANCETNYNLAQSQLTQLKQLDQELATKKNWGENHLPQIKKELFAKGQATFEQLKETVEKAYFVKGKNEVKEKLDQLASFFNQPPLSYSEIVQKK